MNQTYAQPGGFSALPPVVTTVLLANGVAFLAQFFLGDFLLAHLALWPIGTPDYTGSFYGRLRIPDFELWQLVSYSFLHGGLLHLFTNMFAMWMFGMQIENLWGSRLFAFYYFVCVIGAGLVQLVVASLSADDGGGIYPTIGASGGVFGVLLAFGMMFPNQRILLLIPPIPIKAKWFVILYGAFELYAGVTGTLAGVAHFAHLGGMLFGFVLIVYWRRRFLRH
jgi:membrane associated rhomboid family serine protease